MLRKAIALAFGCLILIGNGCALDDPGLAVGLVPTTGAPAFDPRRETRLHEDFSGNAVAGETAFSSSGINSGTVTLGGAVAQAGRPGIVVLTTVTATNSAAGINRSNNTGLLVGGGVIVIDWGFFLSNLSDGTDTYAFRVGCGDTQTADFVNGFYIEYDSTASANYRIAAAENSARTKNTSSVAVTAAAWHNARLVANADGTSVEGFVDNVSIGTVTGANLPDVTPRYCHLAATMVRTAGTASRTVRLDYASFYQRFATPR